MGAVFCKAFSLANPCGQEPRRPGYPNQELLNTLKPHWPQVRGTMSSLLEPHHAQIDLAGIMHGGRVMSGRLQNAISSGMRFAAPIFLIAPQKFFGRAEWCDSELATRHTSLRPAPNRKLVHTGPASSRSYRVIRGDVARE